MIKKLSRIFKNRAKYLTSFGWDAAGRGRRLRGWSVASRSINSMIYKDLADLRARSRHAVLNNPVATNAVEVIVSNCIGSGIKPQPKATDKGFREELQNLWKDWNDEACSDGLTNFYGLQSLVCRSMIEGGSCFVRFRINENNNSIPLQLQLLEAEHLDRSIDYDLPSGNVVKQGIEFNKSGERIAYYLYENHPGDNFGNIESIRIDASEILHIFKPIRAGQIDGVPWLSNVLLKLHELDKYDDAEVVRKQVAAMFAGFITRLDAESSVMGEEESEVGAELMPGTIQTLFPGEDIKFSEPADVGSSYDHFMRQQLRLVAMGMGISYEQLTGDLTQVNYSSIRAGLIEFRRKCQMIQRNIIIHQLCRPVWNKWLQLAILSGALSIADTKTYKPVKWIPQGWDWVDPLKDIEAQKLAVRSGFKSRAEVVSAYGYDAEDIDMEVSVDNQRADSLDLKYDSDPRENQ